MAGERIPTVDEALAYADGYKHALDDCDRADVARLIEERDAEQCRHSFTKAQLSIAERKLGSLAATACSAAEERQAIVTWLELRAEALESETPLGTDTREHMLVRASCIRSLSHAIVRAEHLRDRDASLAEDALARLSPEGVAARAEGIAQIPVGDL